MQKVYFITKNPSLLQELCGTIFSYMETWTLPDKSADIIVALPKTYTARRHIGETLKGQGVVVLPGPHDRTPLDAATLSMFVSITLPPGAMARHLYAAIAELSLMDMMHPDT